MEETTTQTQTKTELTPAERWYINHLKNVSTYQKNNPEKVKEKCKKWAMKLKEDPEKYKDFQDRKREYYINVVKPKLLQNKELKLKLKEDLKIENVKEN
jgi:hypothetical protein